MSLIFAPPPAATGAAAGLAVATAAGAGTVVVTDAVGVAPVFGRNVPRSQVSLCGANVTLSRLATRYQSSIDGGAARATQRVVRLQSEGERAAGVLDVDQQRVGRILDRVGLADVCFTAVEDQRVSGEVEQQLTATVFASHAQAYLAGVWSDSGEYAGERAQKVRVVGGLRRSRRGLGIRRLRERANNAATHCGPVVWGGRGSGRYAVFIVSRGEVADDDVAFDVNQARAGEATIGAHGQHNWIGLVQNRDPNRAGPLLDTVGARVGGEFAAAIEGNAAFAEVEGGDS